MKIAFYSLDNSQNYGRDTFDKVFDLPKLIMEMLSKLSDEEVRIYDFDSKIDTALFQEDYNDGVLDSGWWCVVIND